MVLTHAYFLNCIHLGHLISIYTLEPQTDCSQNFLSSPIFLERQAYFPLAQHHLWPILPDVPSPRVLILPIHIFIIAFIFIHSFIKYIYSIHYVIVIIPRAGDNKKERQEGKTT